MAEVETISDACSTCGKTSPMLKELQCDHRCCLACLDNVTSQRLRLDDSDLEQCAACHKHLTPSADCLERPDSVTVRDDCVQVDAAGAVDGITDKSDDPREDVGKADKVEGMITSTVDKELVHVDVSDAMPSNPADDSARDNQGETSSQGVQTKADKNNNEKSVDAKSLENDELKKATEENSSTEERLIGGEILDQNHLEIQLTPAEDKPDSLKTGFKVDGSAFVSEVEDPCKQHPCEVLTIYCKACDQPMCVQCFLQDHKTHSVEDIKVAREHIRSTLSVYISRMSEVLSMSETKGVDLSEHLIAVRRSVDESANRLHETVDRDAQLLRDALAAQEAEIDRKKSVKDGHKLELKKLRSTCQDKADAGQELVDWNEIKELNKQAVLLEAKLRAMTDDETSRAARENLEKVNFVALDLGKFMPPNEKNVVGKVVFGQQDDYPRKISYDELQDRLQQETRHITELRSKIELLEQRKISETGQVDAELHNKLQQLRNDLELEREHHRKEMTKLREEHSEHLKHLTKLSESSMSNALVQTQQERESEREVNRLKRSQEEKELDRSAPTPKQHEHNQSDYDLSLSGLADYNAKVLKNEEPSGSMKRRSSSGLNKSTRTLSTDLDSDVNKVQTTPEAKSNAIVRRQSDHKKPSDAKSTTTSGAEPESHSSDANVRPSDIVKSQIKSSVAPSSEVEAESQSSDSLVRPSDVVIKSQMKSRPTSGAEADSNSSDANVRPSDVVKSQLKSSNATTANNKTHNKPKLDPLKSPSKDDSELTAGGLTSPMTPDSRRNLNAANAVKQLSPGVLGQYGSVIDCAGVWKAYQEVLDDKSPTQWLKLGHEDKKIVVLSTGNTYQQFKDTLTDDQGLYGFVRLTSGDEHAKLPKFVLIMWVGTNVPAPQAAMMTLGKAHVTAIIENRMLEVRASSLQEIEEQVLLEALRKVGGSI